jgi:hypothetical protein
MICKFRVYLFACSIRLLHNTAFNYKAVTICVPVVATRVGNLLSGATATDAVLSTDINDPGFFRTAGVAIPSGSISPPINPDESTRALSTPIF